MTDWYIEERGYLRKALIYDAVALFVLIDNLKYVEFNFSGEVYDVKRYFSIYKRQIHLRICLFPYDRRKHFIDELFVFYFALQMPST